MNAVNFFNLKAKIQPKKFSLYFTLKYKVLFITFGAQTTKRTVMTFQNKRLTGIVLAVALLLLVPFIAMQFTAEVNWTLSDFVAAGALLLGTGLLCELVLRKVKRVKYRIALCASILVVLLIVWIELAVGIFGTPFAGS